MEALHVAASNTVPTPIKARSPKCVFAFRIAAIALGVVIVISMASTPPASKASESGGTSSAFGARTTAMIPGSRSWEMICDRERMND